MSVLTIEAFSFPLRNERMRIRWHHMVHISSLMSWPEKSQRQSTCHSRDHCFVNILSNNVEHT